MRLSTEILVLGTGGRYHGLLHSGGRYVIRDPQSARECAHENALLHKIIPSAIEDTGGYFVTTPADPADYADQFAAACKTCHVPRPKSLSPKPSSADRSSTQKSAAPLKCKTPPATRSMLCACWPGLSRRLAVMCSCVIASLRYSNQAIGL